MKTASKSGYKLLKKVKDEKFDVDQLHHYDLLILIGIRDLQVSIIDSKINRCLFLEDYVLAKVTSYDSLIEVLESVFDNHHLLKAGFWRNVKVAVKNQKFSLVPSSLFSEDSIYDYLKLNCKVNPKLEYLLYFKHLKSNAVNTFTINKKLRNWLTNTYQNIDIGFIHQSSTLIEGVLNQINKYPDDTVFIYVDRFMLHIVTTKNKQLEYYNQFAIKKFPDYIKYIMLVMNGLNRDQKTTNVVMWGYIGKQSTHYKEFNKYIKNISFGDRPNFLTFGYNFDELQDHHYFDTYNLHICE